MTLNTNGVNVASSNATIRISKLRTIFKQHNRKSSVTPGGKVFERCRFGISDPKLPNDRLTLPAQV